MLLVCLGCLFSILAASPGWAAFSGTVVKVIDGDSLLIIAKKKSVEVRLYGIDCPEYGQPFAGEAKRFVTAKVFNKKVTVYPKYRDAYGRLVAIVSCGGTVLNGDIIKAGFAWVYPRYCKKKICKSWQKNEERARQSHIGLWAGRGILLPPWQWRNSP